MTPLPFLVRTDTNICFGGGLYHLVGCCCNPGQKNEEKLVALINSEVGMERLELIQETIMKIGLLI